MAERRAVVFLSHADEGSLRLAGSCALAAVALGARVDVFLFGPAVPALVEAHGDAPDEPGGLLHRARRDGGCRLVACSASLVEQKVPLEAAERALDAVVGWPTILEWSAGVVERFSF
ncbi:MAG TPA: DsrE family protein [Anaeromyxobacter sp.]|nr:DsrE family protein [Anaeromyxobacter sp.]